MNHKRGLQLLKNQFVVGDRTFWKPRNNKTIEEIFISNENLSWYFLGTVWQCYRLLLSLLVLNLRRSSALYKILTVCRRCSMVCSTILFSRFNKFDIVADIKFGEGARQIANIMDIGGCASHITWMQTTETGCLRFGNTVRGLLGGKGAPKMMCFYYLSTISYVKRRTVFLDINKFIYFIFGIIC